MIGVRTLREIGSSLALRARGDLLMKSEILAGIL